MSNLRTELSRVSAKLYPWGKVHVMASVEPEWSTQTAEALGRSLLVTSWLDAKRFHAEMWKRGVPPDVTRRVLESALVDDETSLRDDPSL